MYTRRYTLLLATLFVPLSVSAASLHFGDYFLKGAEQTPDDIYVIGETSTFAGSVAGDVMSVGRNVFSQSDVSGDAFIVGEALRLGGTVHDDARLIGGVITLDGVVQDDVVVLGSKVLIGPTARIEGTLYAVGGEVELFGTVQGSAKIVSGALRVAGAVGDDLEVWGRAAFEKGSRIGGDFIHHFKGKSPSPQNVIITGATVLDEVKRDNASSLLDALAGGFVSLRILMMLGLAFSLFFLARERTEEVLLDTLSHFGQRLLRGFLILLLAPVVVVLLAFSVVGIPVALALGALCALLVLFSWAYAGVLFGAWIERFFFRYPPFPLSYRPVFLGAIFVSLISLIPLVGPLVHGILLVAVAGSLGTLFSRLLRRKP